MKYYCLASGSGGNSTALVNDDDEILLIDCGLSIKELKCRLQKVNLSFDNVKKILITHTHTDHIKAIRAFNNEDVYINLSTHMNEYNQFDYYQTLNILGFNIYVIPSSHDSSGSSNFIITYGQEKMAYITDTGYVHENIQRLINNCDIYCIESNHDPRLLMLTKRPIELKNRILSVNGHLSNKDCAYILGNVLGPKTKEIVFLHRSLEANSECMICETFCEMMKQMHVDISNIKINIARQNEPISFGEENELFAARKIKIV
ncbi:MAG: MBL fold metallo-hydrolase [Erysipelotrichaceae bacterium]|nr:MBL fold metallo-hydrolase [Erysipelotrichaceae bacterium]